MARNSLCDNPTRFKGNIEVVATRQFEGVSPEKLVLTGVNNSPGIPMMEAAFETVCIGGKCRCRRRVMFSLVRTKACKRCGGDLSLEQDKYGTYVECIQCGAVLSEADLELADKPRTAAPVKPAATAHGRR